MGVSQQVVDAKTAPFYRHATPYATCQPTPMQSKEHSQRKSPEGLKRCSLEFRWIDAWHPNRTRKSCTHPTEIPTMLMDEYRVTYSNGTVVEIEAWTPEAAEAIAEEDAELQGWSGLSVVSVELLASHQLEL